jgi:hypothetical protein
VNAYVTERALDKIAQLAGQGLDLPAFWQESAAVLARAVPHYSTPCWWTLDPASLLMTNHYNPEVPDVPPAWLEIEYLEDDVHKLADVARGGRGVPRFTRRPAATRAAAAGTARRWSPSAPSRSFGPACARATASRGDGDPLPRVRPAAVHRRRGRPPARAGAVPRGGHQARSPDRRSRPIPRGPTPLGCSC